MKKFLSHSLLLSTFIPLFVVSTVITAQAHPHKRDAEKGRWHNHHRHHSIHKFMKQADRNDDGILSQTEYKQAQLNRFKKMDINQDGYITKADREALKTKRKAHQEKMMMEKKEKRQKRIAEIDKNKDGKISQTEFLTATPSFMKLDSNKDGNLSKEEIKTNMKKHMKLHGHGQ